MGVLAWEGAGSCGAGQRLGGSSSERASAAVPLAPLHPRTLPLTRGPVPSTCPVSLWEGRWALQPEPGSF